MPSRLFATQTCPAPYAIADGPLPTSIRVADDGEETGTRMTPFPTGSVTHSESPPYAIPCTGAWTSIVSSIDPSFGSSRVIVPSPAFVTQTEPLPTATPVGEFPTV